MLPRPRGNLLFYFPRKVIFGGRYVKGLHIQDYDSNMKRKNAPHLARKAYLCRSCLDIFGPSCVSFQSREPRAIFVGKDATLPSSPDLLAKRVTECMFAASDAKYFATGL